MAAKAKKTRKAKSKVKKGASVSIARHRGGVRAYAHRLNKKVEAGQHVDAHKKGKKRGAMSSGVKKKISEAVKKSWKERRTKFKSTHGHGTGAVTRKLHMRRDARAAFKK